MKPYFAQSGITQIQTQADYAHFTGEFVKTLVSSLQTSTSDRDKEAAQQLDALNGETKLTAARKVQKARRILGRSNRAYLQASVFCLCGNDDDQLALYPSTYASDPSQPNAWMRDVHNVVNAKAKAEIHKRMEDAQAQLGKVFASKQTLRQQLEWLKRRSRVIASYAPDATTSVAQRVQNALKKCLANNSEGKAWQTLSELLPAKDVSSPEMPNTYTFRQRNTSDDEANNGTSTKPIPLIFGLTEKGQGDTDDNEKWFFRGSTQDWRLLSEYTYASMLAIEAGQARLEKDRQGEQCRKYLNLLTRQAYFGTLLCRDPDTYRFTAQNNGNQTNDSVSGIVATESVQNYSYTAQEMLFDTSEFYDSWLQIPKDRVHIEMRADVKCLVQAWDQLDTLYKHSEALGKAIEHTEKVEPCDPCEKVEPCDSSSDDSSSDSHREAKRPRMIDMASRMKRYTVWSDGLRELAISSDRLYVFLRQMSGTLHEDVDALIRLDDSANERLARQRQQQRADALRLERSFRTRMIEMVLTSILKDSKLRMDLGDAANPATAKTLMQQPLVVNTETIERLRALESGQSGLPFFEASKETERQLKKAKEQPSTLADLVQSVQTALDASAAQRMNVMMRNDEGRDLLNDEAASLDYLMAPRTSYVLRLRNQAFAAIRTSYDHFSREYLAQSGGKTPPLAYTLIEGRNDALMNGFATLCAYVLASSRMHSSSEAAYLSVSAAKTNTMQVKAQLRRVVDTALGGAGTGSFNSGNLDHFYANARHMANSYEPPHLMQSYAFFAARGHRF